MSRWAAMCAGRPETHAQGYRKAKDQNAAEEQQKVIHIYLLNVAPSLGRSGRFATVAAMGAQGA
jgi:hypothetical protein